MSMSGLSNEEALEDNMRVGRGCLFLRCSSKQTTSRGGFTSRAGLCAAYHPGGLPGHRPGVLPGERQVHYIAQRRRRPPLLSASCLLRSVLGPLSPVIIYPDALLAGK
jgi:hypothetical protein